MEGRAQGVVARFCAAERDAQETRPVSGAKDCSRRQGRQLVYAGSGDAGCALASDDGTISRLWSINCAGWMAFQPA